MARNSTYNILMYSHDTYGLGHIRRSMAIASHLREPHQHPHPDRLADRRPLLLSRADRFRAHPGNDQAHQRGIPAALDQDQRPPRPGHPQEHHHGHGQDLSAPALHCRQGAPGAQARGAAGAAVAASLPARTQTILGLRDIMDDRRYPGRSGARRGSTSILEDALQRDLDLRQPGDVRSDREYAISEAVSRKVVLPATSPARCPSAEGVQAPQGARPQRGGQAVVVTTGGGGDGYCRDGRLSAHAGELRGCRPSKAS
jgi:hypothetical protein